MMQRILVACCLLLGLSSARSQMMIDTAFNRYARQLPQQKVHLHFDNQVYIPGQTIWFKAYLFSGAEPAGYSKNLYVDWYDDQGKYFTRTVSPVSNASASASLTIPSAYTGRKLEAVAYTQWMLNFDTAFLFHRTLTVVQPGRKPLARVTKKTTLNFFPEAGDMIQGMLATIAFKATDQSGYPVHVSGVIKSKSGEQVAEFESRHDGMGIVKFIPSAEDVYTAEWKDADTKTYKTVLPAAKPNGIMLGIGKGFGDRPFVLQRSENVSENLKKVYLVVQSHQQIVFKANINLTDKTEINGKIPASKFPSGISQVTVFDLNWQPLAERIIFVNNEEFRSDAGIRFDTVSVLKRGKNVFQLFVNDTTPATYSLSVTDDKYGYDADNSIVTDFLLSSDIKGYVHNPSYYFSSKADSIAGQLDLVMLTNGWRRFAWQDVMQSRKPTITFPIDTNYLSIRGKIEGVPADALIKAKTVNLVLSGKDSSKQYLFLPITADGIFETENLVIFDTTKVYFKINNAPLNSKARMGLLSSLLPVDTNKTVTVLNPVAADELPDSVRNQIASMLRRGALDDVTVYTKSKTRLEEMDEQYATGIFKGDAFQFNLADKQEQALSIYNYLQSRVGGLLIRTNGINGVTATWQGAPTDIFLDEFQLSDPASLFTVPMSDVAYIKVFRPPFAGSFLGGPGGAIAVYTKKGSDASRGMKGLKTSFIAGYTLAKEFYSPDYTLTNAQAIADTRATLLWRPDIMTDANRKKINFSFFNNDITQRFRVILEGMNDDGKLVHISTVVK